MLRFCLLALGISAIGIGASMMLLGPDATGRFFAGIVELVLQNNIELTGFTSADVDSELRFYAVFWIAYGVILVRTSRSSDLTTRTVPILVGLFFTGGVGRLLSFLSVGQPHTLFIALMIVELVLPVLMIILWQLGRRKAEASEKAV